MANEIEFRPLQFHSTTHDALRPRLFDGDHTHGEDFTQGELLSMALGKRALLFAVRYTAGPDARVCGWHEDEVGEVEYLVVQKQRFVGTITKQTPAGFCSLGTEEVQVLDSLGGPTQSTGGRQSLHFYGHRYMKGYQGGVSIAVTVYIRMGLFGGWKEIVVKTPKKSLYVARV